MSLDISNLSIQPELYSWHERLFQVMLANQKTHEKIYFSLRRNFEKTLGCRSELWFAGSDTGESPTLTIGLTSNYDTVKKQPSIGILVKFKLVPGPIGSIPLPPQLNIESIRFQILCIDRNNRKFEELFSEIIESVGISYNGWSRSYTLILPYNNSYQDTISIFLEKNAHIFIQKYDKYSSFNFRISKDQFEDTLKKKEQFQSFLNNKKIELSELTDEINERNREQNKSDYLSFNDETYFE